MSVAATLERLLRERILQLDGAMGTMLQSYRLDEAAFRGERFADHPTSVQGCNDLLSLTRPDVVEEVHRRYLEAGADVVETNTFTATAISLADYGLEDLARELNREAARVARRAVEAFLAGGGQGPRFVGGSIGPTNRTASLSPDVNDPGLRGTTFAELERCYREQVLGLLEGGVDLLFAETAFDTLNLKAALMAIENAFAEWGGRVPVVASLTITDQSGRTLSGQTLEAAWNSIAHADLLAVGLNCALGPEQMRPHLEELAHLSPLFVACYPNAGLPNELGGYDLTPEAMAAMMREFAAEGWVNLIGGCCGTDDRHVAAMREAVRGLPPHRRNRVPSRTRLSGLEPLTIQPESNFIMVGERTNITGSRRFARLIRSDDFEGAVAVAREQVVGGANILDVNMDEGLIDSEQAMVRFLNLIGSEPEIARIPVMLDSSRFSVIEAGLACLQGKGVVNSISLKEGEDVFRGQARLIRRFGAAVVVMAFDEQGQAVDPDRKVAILARAHRILTEEVGFPESDIIFDPNVLTVATGIAEHDRYAVAFIDATRELKRRFPACKVSGGISNVSFSFRGNDVVREAMHAAFLYHAIEAGLDMGIVNAGQLAVYEDLDPTLLERVEDVLLARRPDATERLLDLAASVKGPGTERARDDAWRAGDLDARLRHALVHGQVDHVAEDVAEALERYPSPLAIIEGPLMAGMNVVGDLFGAGKMFLPQVVKSARVMKKAVAILEPLMEAERRESGARERGRVLLATVKGDVHDIGKNIVGVVLACNNYDVVDLGVMVPAERILREARERQVDLIGLSGLITPSLDEMIHVAAEMSRLGLRTPLLIGGATTSAKHTALRIAPAYDGPTVHVADASRAVEVVGQLASEARRDAFVEDVRRAQAELRENARGAVGPSLLTIEEARRRAPDLGWEDYTPDRPSFLGVRTIDDQPLGDLVPFVDWTPFFHAWELRGSYPRILDDPKYGPPARDLFDQARTWLDRIVAERWLTARAVWGFFPAWSEGDDLVLGDPDAERPAPVARVATVRQQQTRAADAPCLALSDFVAPAASGRRDHVGLFAVTTGHGAAERVARLEADHDDFGAIMVKALADRLAEAFAEKLHRDARVAWGYGEDERLRPEDLLRERYRGIRPAPGYPACPDHSDKRLIWRLLDAEARAGIRLTDSCAMDPAASVSGVYFSHPEARYFSVGRIGRDQVRSLAERKGIDVAEVERWLGPNLAYEPERSAAPRSTGS